MKQRALTIAAAVLTIAAALIWALQGDDNADPMPASVRSELTPAPEMPTGPPAPVATEAAELASYAISTAELQGLPPDLASGSTIDLWVTWQPPLTKRPKVQRLLQGVRLERLAPPLLPDGPHAAILAVPVEKIPRLIWGDRFGALTAVAPPRR